MLIYLVKETEGSVKSLSVLQVIAGLLISTKISKLLSLDLE